MQLVKPEPARQAPRAVPAHWAARLIERMRGLYGERFDRQWSSIEPEDLPRIWAEELAGFSGEELARGLAACRQRDWPPTIPEFMKLCRPALVPDIAFHDAVAGMNARNRGERGAWSHPAIFWAAVRLGTHELLNSGYAVLRGRWERILAEELARGQWDPVPDPAVALPAPAVSEADRAQATRVLRDLGAADALSQSGRDHRRWIRRVLAHGDRKPLAVVAMAQRAAEVTGEVSA